MNDKKQKKPKSASPKRKTLPISQTSVGSNEAILVAAAAGALGLPTDSAWKTSVILNIQLIMRHAALVDEFPLPDEAEPAPVFRA
jgi:1-carboxybiuret hydrolase subunit AtzG-like